MVTDIHRRTQRRRLRDDHAPDRPTVASKRSLVAVSHAIERAVLDGPVTEPTVVVALFQRLAYFEREYEVYARLAEAGVVVVLAFADGEAHQVPPGCDLVVLDPAEPLAEEWSVVAVGPAAGAYLVATDAHRFDPTEHTLEAGREFTGRWGYSRVQAANELARMRVAIGARLETATAATIDGLLAGVMPAGGAAASSTGTDGEVWATLSLHRMVQRMQDAREGSRLLREQLADAHAAVSARAGAHVDPQSGLITPEFLSRWAGNGRATALPVGVAVFDVPALDRVAHGHDDRAAHHATRKVAAALTEPLGPVDVAVRLSEREFAIVVPAASTRHLRRLVAVVAEQLELTSDGYPHVPLRATVASTVTLARPLPLDDLHLALGSPEHPGETLAGDTVAVVTTDTVAADPTDPPTSDPTEAFPRVRVPGRPGDGQDDAADVDASDAVVRRADRAFARLTDLPRRARRDDEERPVVAAPTGTDGHLADPARRNGTWLGDVPPDSTA